MRLHLCGVRGSTPAPGAQFAAVGGHTSCVAVAHDGAPPTLVLDAGTGLRRVSDLLANKPFHGTILLGHLHWDHVQGLPFFTSGDHEDAEVRLLVPAQGCEPLELLERAMSPPHFPISPSQLRGKWRFEAIEEGVHEIEGFDVLAREIPHKGGRTFGYRVTEGSTAVAYLSDHGPAGLEGRGAERWGAYHDAARHLVDSVAVLIHDAQHLRGELDRAVQHGHSVADYAVGLAEHCKAERLLLFHHHPERTDAQVAALIGELHHSRVRVEAAIEERVIELPAVPVGEPASALRS